MTQLWARLVRGQRIHRSLALPLEEGDAAFQQTLEALCRALDIPRPLWLGKHEREWARFQRTGFTQEHFIEHIAFDRLELERIDPDNPRPPERDPRIEA